MSTIWQKVFWRRLTTKIVKTTCQTAGGMLVASPVLNMFEVEWYDIVGVAGLSGVVCALMNIGSSDNEPWQHRDQA